MPHNDRRARRKAQRCLRKINCHRCGRRFDGRTWFTQLDEYGQVDHHVCQGCTTAIDYVEAVIHDATTVHRWIIDENDNIRTLGVPTKRYEWGRS